MAECNWPVDKPPNAPAILKIKPGYLNPFNEDAVNEESIDYQCETAESIIGRTIKKAFTPDVFKTVNTCKGIMMRVDNPDDPNSPCTSEDLVVGATYATKDSNKYNLPTYKIRIPEIHFSLPIPNSLEEPCDQDQMIMDTYPSIQAENRVASKHSVQPGDLCLVKIGNNGSLTKLFYAGPVDSEGVVLPKDDGSSPLPQGKCLEDYDRIYFNSGAPGDPIGEFIDTINKVDNGVSPVIYGEGISDGAIIAGSTHKKWLIDLLYKKKQEGKYKGIIWAGVCENNGPADDLKMLSTDGTITATGDPGRSTIIYMPTGVDPTFPLEIIYWFHDELGFQNGGQEWNNLWRDLEGMIKKREAAGRRNFVLVIPEMLWSREGAHYETGVPRRQTKAIVGSCDQWKCATPGAKILPATVAALTPVYRDREWAAWGFNGVPVLSDRNTPGTIFDIPFSYRPLWDPNSRPPIMLSPPLEGMATLTPDVAGDMVLLHQEVLGLLEKHFGFIERQGVASNVVITLFGEQKGGIAISNLARMGKLGKNADQIYPTKIVFAHSDYSGMNGYGTDPVAPGAPGAGQLEGSNWYHDNDLYEIIKNIDSDTQVEVHIMWTGLPERPRQCASAFFGTLRKISLENVGQPFSYCVERLKDFYKKKLWMGTYTNPPQSGLWTPPTNPLVEAAKEANSCGKPPIWDEATTSIKLKQLYEQGGAFIKSNQNEAVRLAAPFDNIVYKGWRNNTTQGVLGWVFDDTNTKVSLQKEQPVSNQFIVESGVSLNIQAIFKNFYGNTILYRSGLVGPSKNVAILAPSGTSPFQPYELIYYLHGNIGKNGAAKTYRAALENQIRAMVETQGRNVIIVLMDIDPTPSSVSSMLWANGDFNNFHEEILNKIKKHWARPFVVEKCLPGPSLDTPAFCMEVSVSPQIIPAFFSIKAWSGGSRMLNHVIQNLSNEYIEKPGGLQRIDFLDANWGIEEGTINTIYTDPNWAAVKPGENFEIQMFASSVTFPPQNFSAEQMASKYIVPPPEGLAVEGVWVTNAVGTPAGSVPYKYFSALSKLTMITPPLTSDAAVDFFPTELDLAGSEYYSQTSKTPPAGISLNAFYLQGWSNMALTDPGLSIEAAPFFRGNLKNQTPATEEMGYPKDYDAACRQVQTTAKSSTDVLFTDTQNCETNPLGLIDYKTFKFSNIKIDPQRKEFTWATGQLGEYLKALDNPIWAKTTNAGAPMPTTWVVKDLSPQWANGVDKVSGHVSHREGIDIDVALPKKGQGEHGLKALIASDLDTDRALVFLILSKLNGAKRVFLDKKFFKPLEKRANFIATDGASSGGTGKIFGGDKVLKPFLKENLYGKPKVVKELMRMLEHEVGHQSHFHVRILRTWGSHQTPDYPRWAINRLKNMGCNYKGQPSI